MTLGRILLDLDRREHRGEGLPLYAPPPVWEEEEEEEEEPCPHAMDIDFTLEFGEGA